MARGLKKMWSAYKKGLTGESVRDVSRAMSKQKKKVYPRAQHAFKARDAERLEKMMSKRKLESRLARGGTAAALVGAGAGAGALARGGSKEKKSMDDMVMDRANEILDAAVEVIEDYEKTSADDEAITAAALEVLDANDYDVDLIVDILSEE